MASEPVKIKYGIVCDIVRREDNGKLLLIGVYGDSIIVPKFPATLVLSLVLRIEAIQSTERAIEVRIRIADRTIQVASGSISTTSAGVALIHIGNIPVPDLKEPGVLNFQVKIGESQWKTVCSHRLDLSEQPSRA